MKNAAISAMFQEIADLLAIKGDDSFKIMAYNRAARSMAELTEDIAVVAAEDRLKGIPGIGDALAAKIREGLETGTCSFLEELRREFPAGLLEMLQVPGVGAKTVARVYHDLHIQSLPELEAAARAGRLEGLPKIGPKTQQNIIEGIERLKRSQGRVPMWSALPLALSIVERLNVLPEVERIEIAGSLRRWKESVGDLDLVAASRQADRVIQEFTHLPEVTKVTGAGETKASIVAVGGINVDLRVLPPEDYFTALHHFTGSKEHNVRLRGRAKQMGLKINEYGLFRVPGDPGGGAAGEAGSEDGAPPDGAVEKLKVESEEDLYRWLGLPYIPPELREDRGEIEAAEADRLPKLIEPKDIRGDLHNHTDWSDGRASIAVMAEAARGRGYEYLAIADHTKSLAFAHGLDEARLRQQMKDIAAYNAAQAGGSQADGSKAGADFRLLAATEVDILPDGRLDLPDEVLSELDFVTASVHSNFRQTREQMTERVGQAMKNPNVDSIGHPTGRLIGRREPYEIDMEKVIDGARATGTFLEMNASPDRLDLSDRHAREAKEAGVKIVINTDAHDPRRLDEMLFGVHNARRAWLEPGDVVNAQPWEEVRRWLKKA
ncbi:MAG: helix-hairpin-helix domain-containing protein [Bacillota bacterium]